jgi:cytochrome P450
MSYIPFLAGKRVCVGKTFAENSIKTIVPLILKAFHKIEFVNKDYYKVKPHHNIVLQNIPEIKLKLHF